MRCVKTQKNSRGHDGIKIYKTIPNNQSNRGVLHLKATRFDVDINHYQAKSTINTRKVQMQ